MEKKIYQKKYQKKKRKIYKRQKPTRPYRRKKRRKRKVKRKKQTIPIRQWQPDSINKCKIIRYSATVVSAKGTQIYCYTAEKDKYVPPKVP